MKPHHTVLILVFALMVACTPKGDNGMIEPRPGTSLPTEASTALANIDSLMWRQPDSALACLLSYFDTCCRDAMIASRNLRRIQCVSTTTFDDHYAQLLAAELLYKNDYQQTNRTDLQQAVAYFDSLVRETPPFKGAGGIQRTSDPNLFFLAARAHYINGVGYYEQDSVVPACQQYLKALGIMEGHFAEKELVGKKAHFMALTFTHLTAVFSDLYLSEQALYFGRRSLAYFQKYEASPQHVAWMLDEIGSHFEMMKHSDSAWHYYQAAMEILPDTNTQIFRDITTHKAFLEYEMEKRAERPLNQLRNLLSQAESEREVLSRSSIIGELFYHEKQYDSAERYLTKVFHESQNIDAKKQAAEWLVEICKTQGRTSEIMEYADFLVPFANVNENQGFMKSQLTELCHEYEQDRQEALHQQKTQKMMKWANWY